MVDRHRSSRVSVRCAVALLLSSVWLTCGGEIPDGGGTSTAATDTRLSTTPEVRIDWYDHDLVPVTWFAVDGEGEPIGTAFLPRSAEVLAADRSHLWTVERDEVDVPSVVRYRVEQHVSGG